MDNKIKLYYNLNQNKNYKILKQIYYSLGIYYYKIFGLNMIEFIQSKLWRRTSKYYYGKYIIKYLEISFKFGKFYKSINELKKMKNCLIRILYINYYYQKKKII